MPRYSQILSFTLESLAFYCLVGVFILICQFCSANQKRGGLILVVFTTVLSAIRCNVGSDYFPYYTIYINVLKYFNSIADVFHQRFQNGIVALSLVLRRQFASDYALFIAVSIFVGAIIWIVYRKESMAPAFSVGIWVLSGLYLSSMNILKQTIAMELLLIAFFLLRKGKVFGTIIFCFLAAAFHITAIVAILGYAISRMLLKPGKSFWPVVFLSFLGVVVLHPILTLITKIPLFSKYQIYLTEVDNVSLKLKIGAFLTVILLLVVVYFCGKAGFAYGSVYYDISQFLFFGLIVAILSLKFYFLVRLSYYSIQFIPIVIPTLLSRVVSKNSRQKLTALTVILFVVYGTFNVAFAAENEYYNYSTIYNDSPVSVQEFNSRW